MVRPPLLVRLLYKDAVWQIPEKEKNVYLTFDDGPIPEVTPWVIEQLDQYKAKATFFCVGKNVEQHREIFAKLIDQGHSVGNHTYSHFNGWKTKREDYLEDVEKCQHLVNSKLFRPPYGKISFRQLKEVKQSYQVILWSISTLDFDKKETPKNCLNRIKKYLRPGSIIVMHDSLKAEKNLKRFLPGALEYISSKGFNLKSIPQSGS